MMPKIRYIEAKTITKKTAELVQNTATYLRPDALKAFKSALKTETSTPSKTILNYLIKNAELAKKNNTPCCQDTGLEILYCELGEQVLIKNGHWKSALQKGIKLGSKQGCLRQSVVSDPLIRINTKTNAPGLIHFDLVPGNQIKITCLSKGFGCENKGQIKMFNPTASIDEIKTFILDSIAAAGSNACPPFLIGIGMGGTLDHACDLAKRAQLTPIGKRNSKPHLAKFEQALLKAANALNIGPLGLGGKTTCLDIKILAAPTHIAGLPVAVNIGCHAIRSQSITI